MKIYCNKCFQPLVTHEYPEGLYIDTCECIEKLIEKKEEIAYNDGYKQGHDEYKEYEKG